MMNENFNLNVLLNTINQQFLPVVLQIVWKAKFLNTVDKSMNSSNDTVLCCCDPVEHHHTSLLSPAMFHHFWPSSFSSCVCTNSWHYVQMCQLGEACETKIINLSSAAAAAAALPHDDDVGTCCVCFFAVITTSAVASAPWIACHSRPNAVIPWVGNIAHGADGANGAGWEQQAQQACENFKQRQLLKTPKAQEATIAGHRFDFVKVTSCGLCSCVCVCACTFLSPVVS